MTRLCWTALQAGIEIEYVQQLIRHNRLVPEDGEVLTESWPWPLKIYTLGRFVVLVDDRPLRFTGKAQRKPMELLKALIAFGGRQVRETKLADALWPDAEGDAAQQALATTVFRLRKLIGDEAIRRQEGGLSLNPYRCWVDCWATERLLGGADGGGGIDEIAALYHGPFLNHEDELFWALPLREKLHTKLILHLCESGRRLVDAGCRQDALAVYQHGLEIDDSVEEFYCGLMRCYADLGYRSEVESVYRHCRQALVSHKTEPSTKTRRLYVSLRSLE